MARQVLNTRVMMASLSIASSYISKNDVPPEMFQTLIARIHTTIMTLLDGSRVSGQRHGAADTRPVILADTRNYLICLEDGKRLRSLERYLRIVHNMTPEEYRKKWGLPDDYPMVAPKMARRIIAAERTSQLAHAG